MIEIDLPDGRRVAVAEHLCGWTAAGDPGSALWPRIADAIRALTGRTRDDEPWIAVLEEFAAAGAGPRGEALPPDEQGRLDAVLASGPLVHADGPRAAHGGGWYLFIGGLPAGAWVMEHGDTATMAARAALARAEVLLERA